MSKRYTDKFKKQIVELANNGKSVTDIVNEYSIARSSVNFQRTESMFIDLSKVGIYIIPGYTDMRKQINGLAHLLHDITEIDLQQPNIFIFFGKSKKQLKILYRENNGFCLWQKKLGKDRFPWPKTNQDLEVIDLDRLRLLLKGIDFWKEHKSLDSKVFF